ncbi:MAG: N-acetyltransferase [Selenomonadaceae bacterium]|nr:N-acetyltransferase [Selenomonadaceae bacterium]
MSEVKIRVAEISDAEKILEIYSPYVDRTAVSFEYDLPSIEKFRQRMKHIQKRFPFLVAIIDDEIAGFAYTDLFAERAAYQYCVEASIYLQQDFQRQGIGKLLYEKIEKISRDQNFVSLYARVATTEIEDEFLTNASLKFHEKLGFQIVGKLPKCGFKFDRWYDMTIMMKDLRDRSENPPPILKFSNL